MMMMMMMMMMMSIHSCALSLCCCTSPYSESICVDVHCVKYVHRLVSTVNIFTQCVVDVNRRLCMLYHASLLHVQSSLISQLLYCLYSQLCRKSPVVTNYRHIL